MGRGEERERGGRWGNYLKSLTLEFTNQLKDPKVCDPQPFAILIGTNLDSVCLGAAEGE